MFCIGQAIENNSEQRDTKELKGTLLQIWKSPYMFVFILKQYPENFGFLILRTVESFTLEVCKIS